MKLKLFFQMTLFIAICVILLVFYYSFLKTQNSKNANNNELIKELDKDKSAKLENELLNIEYNSTDKHGNNFYLNAERATINLEQGENIINLSNVVSVINLKNKGNIIVYSNDALYDKITHNTNFYNEVKIEYLDNLILSDNLDIIFTERISKVYNNVVLNNENMDLKTDKVLIDMINGDIKLEMFNNSQKVKLTTNHEYIN